MFRLATIAGELFTMMVPLFANVAGDHWDWVVGVFVRIGDVSIYWLVLALALVLGLFAGATWRRLKAVRARPI